MKSTGWIAVAGWLIASPVFAQTLELPPDPSAPEAASVVSDASPPDSPVSFDLELEQLRHDIAAIKTLREEAAADANQPPTSDAAVSQELRRELLELLTKLAANNRSSKPAPVIPQPPPSPPPPPPAAPTVAAVKAAEMPEATATHRLITDKVLDAYALGRALFRADDFRGAEQAFRKAKVTEDNRVMLQYLIATCLRKQSQWEQAAKAYRAVAENKDDSALRDLAMWQMENIRWYQQTESQLEQLRQLRETADPANAASDAAASAVSPSK